jgi:hypothetical protein
MEDNNLYKVTFAASEPQGGCLLEAPEPCMDTMEVTIRVKVTLAVFSV